MSRHSLEILYRVYNDDDGDYVEIRPDSDALDMTDINQVADGKVIAQIRVPQESLKLIIEALQKRQIDGEKPPLTN